MDKALLPAGFHDLLFPDAAKKSHIMSCLEGSFAKFGFELIEPPVIEFENSLFTGAGKELQNQTFRLMDPVSHKMMGVRSDITTQMARVAVTRLKKSPQPLRLAYGGEVFRVKGEGLYMERQLTQSGIELVGVDSAQADAEVILVTITALKKLGLSGISIDFALPGLVGIITEDMKFKKDQKSALIEAINKKNIEQIENLAGADAQILVKLAGIGITASDLQKLDLPVRAKPLCSRLTQIIEILQASGEDINISIDPLESKKFGYHTGIGFTIFVKGAKGEIGRGGRYEIEDENTAIPASGATIYVNEILRILPAKPQQEKVFVPYGTAWNEAQKLTANENTQILIFGLQEASDVLKAAKQQNCTHIFQSGKLTKI